MKRRCPWPQEPLAKKHEIARQPERVIAVTLYALSGNVLVSDESERAIIAKVIAPGAHSEAQDDWQVWHGVKKLVVHNSLDNVTLPAGLQSLEFGHRYNQSLEEVTLPS